LTNDNPSDDRSLRYLRGAAAIADYLGTTRRRVLYLFENRYAPIAKEGHLLIASTARLDAFYENLCDVEVRPLPPGDPISRRPSKPTPLKTKRRSRTRFEQLTRAGGK
jgi:hypothetical protein